MGQMGKNPFVDWREVKQVGAIHWHLKEGRVTVNVLSRVATYAAIPFQYKAPLKALLSALVRPSPASTGPGRCSLHASIPSPPRLLFFLFANPCWHTRSQIYHWETLDRILCFQECVRRRLGFQGLFQKQTRRQVTTGAETHPGQWTPYCARTDRHTYIPNDWVTDG